MSENPTVKQTILEDGTEFDGSIKSKCPITVSGKLKGEVSAPSLTVTKSGSVHGQVNRAGRFVFERTRHAGVQRRWPQVHVRQGRSWRIWAI